MLSLLNYTAFDKLRLTFLLIFTPRFVSSRATFRRRSLCRHSRHGSCLHEPHFSRHGSCLHQPHFATEVWISQPKWFVSSRTTFRRSGLCRDRAAIVRVFTAAMVRVFTAAMVRVSRTTSRRRGWIVIAAMARVFTNHISPPWLDFTAAMVRVFTNHISITCKHTA